MFSDLWILWMRFYKMLDVIDLNFISFALVLYIKKPGDSLAFLVQVTQSQTINPSSTPPQSDTQ